MKRIFLCLAAIFIYSNFSFAQTDKGLKKVLELKITSDRGANAAAVAWHPIQKKYYAAMAGNEEHQMGVYNTAGKMLSLPTQTALFDVRGFWYNANTKTLQTNGYNNFGWAEYKLDANGIPIDTKILVEAMHQPTEQSVGTYDNKNNVVYFFNADGNLDKYVNYNLDTATINLHLGFGNQSQMDDAIAFDNTDSLEHYNTSAIYTGISGAEIALLNTADKKIELYNIATGFKTKQLILPSDALVKDFLNFSYANNIFWLFDTDTRTWVGYK